jgi:hypothetical protein
MEYILKEAGIDGKQLMDFFHLVKSLQSPVEGALLWQFLETQQGT